MKTYKKIIRYFWLIAIIGLFSNCNDPVIDFGFDSSISGNVLDNARNIVSGDLNSNNIVVKALGTSETVPKIIRVDGEGFYQNTKLFPQPYKFWIEGPFVSVEIDTIFVDLSSNKNDKLNFTVTPLLSIATPELNGSATSTTISINYNIIENDGNEIKSAVAIFSTIPYPTGSTGSGPFYTTIKVSIDNKSGSVSTDELESGVTYFVRIEAKAVGAISYNYSDQLMVTTTSN